MPGHNTEHGDELARWAQSQGLQRIDRDIEELPDSTPSYPYLPDPGSSVGEATTPEEREISAAHLALDALGVPRTRNINVSYPGEKPHMALHDLRLHGRIRFLQEQMRIQGVEIRFPEE